jgi:hypothetical protein
MSSTAEVSIPQKLMILLSSIRVRIFFASLILSSVFFASTSRAAISQDFSLTTTAPVLPRLGAEAVPSGMYFIRFVRVVYEKRKSLKLRIKIEARKYNLLYHTLFFQKMQKMGYLQKRVQNELFFCIISFDIEVILYFHYAFRFLTITNPAAIRRAIAIRRRDSGPVFTVVIFVGATGVTTSSGFTISTGTTTAAAAFAV